MRVVDVRSSSMTPHTTISPQDLVHGVIIHKMVAGGGELSPIHASHYEGYTSIYLDTSTSQAKYLNVSRPNREWYDLLLYLAASDGTKR